MLSLPLTAYNRSFLSRQVLLELAKEQPIARIIWEHRKLRTLLNRCVILRFKDAMALCICTHNAMHHLGAPQAAHPAQQVRALHVRVHTRVPAGALQHRAGLREMCVRLASTAHSHLNTLIPPAGLSRASRCTWSTRRR